MPTASLQIPATAELCLRFAPRCERESIVFIMFRYFWGEVLGVCKISAMGGHLRPMNQHFFSTTSISLSRRQACAVTASLLYPAVASSDVSATDQAVWKALRIGGHTILMRHALAPGTFDPPGFKLGECSTQRNLSDAGRAQAKALGQIFTTMKVGIGTVRSSEWCRCVDTANLAFGANKVQTWPALNSPAQLAPEQRKANADAVRKAIQNLSPRNSSSRANQVFVTHMFNIQDITGESVAEGEFLVMREGPQEPQLVGRLATS
jgi:phosphohistidine phosphatase SixA